MPNLTSTRPTGCVPRSWRLNSARSTDGRLRPRRVRCSGGLGIPVSRQSLLIRDLDDGDKVRVLLAQAVFGDPDILLLDEPTNHLDIGSILWLEEFLISFRN